MSDTMAMRRPAATAPPPPASFDADLPSDPPMESVLDQAWNRVDERLAAAAAGLPEIDIAAVQTQVRGDVPETILLRGGTELAVALEMATGAFCERDPAYSTMAARLLHTRMLGECLGNLCEPGELAELEGEDALYGAQFDRYVKVGVQEGRLVQAVLDKFDLPVLKAALRPERDDKFDLHGLQTLYDRYLLRSGEDLLELPQTFFMRVAMQLAVDEDNPTERAIEFYGVLSRHDFMCSTPTLFNAGTPRPQMSSCFLTTVDDSIEGIFKSIKDNALLSKFSGGLGNDWSRIRSLGSHIKGTNGISNGVVPFLKVQNSTTVAVNQGGRRKGAACAYLESWHGDIREFLALRKNTGDERRRTHDMNTCNWVPDLLMERVDTGGSWTLLSPADAPDLHDLTGSAFRERYEHYEHEVQAGRMDGTVMPAVDLWREMLSALYETGHPWITFKDSSNVRSPQQHDGVIHSSNLCTEITLNTSDDEVAVCNLGSVNLANHLDASGALDADALRRTVRTAVRMLDNVIDVNFYTIPETRASNARHRPVGLGLMGYQDVLQRMGIPFASQDALDFSDSMMEIVSHAAIEASADLAAERGSYGSFEGSLWSQGILPLDTLDRLADERGRPVAVPRGAHLDWSGVRAKARAGMRNSNVMAIAPTATIANIVGVSPSIEPTFRNLHVRSNMSGDFVQLNRHLVRDLKARGLWDDAMREALKREDGDLDRIPGVPEDLRDLYRIVWNIAPEWLIDAAARRGKWIDQSQSLNLYMQGTSGRRMHEIYMRAWQSGLKTTYYLRTLSATQVEKSTLAAVDGRLNAVPVSPHGSGDACNLGDDECEACQ